MIKNIKYWICPKCRYRMTDLQYTRIKTDVGCPRCKISLDYFYFKIDCLHKNTEYQAKESDTNTEEYFICLDCGIDLPMPELIEER